MPPYDIESRAKVKTDRKLRAAMLNLWSETTLFGFHGVSSGAYFYGWSSL